MRGIILTQGKVALVDDTDYEYLNQWKWCAHKQSKTYYAVKAIKINGKKRLLKMHRFILNIIDPLQQIDHRDRNGLNNQRSNLRLASALENSFNKSKRFNSESKYKGVKRTTRGKPWRATIKTNGKYIHLGVFDNQEQAALAYNIAATKLHGEFANINIL